jgi:hypothetical protein
MSRSTRTRYIQDWFLAHTDLVDYLTLCARNSAFPTCQKAGRTTEKKAKQKRTYNILFLRTPTLLTTLHCARNFGRSRQFNRRQRVRTSVSAHADLVDLDHLTLHAKFRRPPTFQKAGRTKGKKATTKKRKGGRTRFVSCARQPC